jgi:hypothetical protein
VTKLNAQLPKGEGNGLAAIARRFIDTPHEVQVAIVLLACKKVTTDHDSGEMEPFARIRRIEPIDEAGDREVAAKMLRRALERRTGKTVLPFDLEEDLRAALNADPETGEITGDN